MDFLKTLMLYMTLVMATAVQGAEAPADMPVITAPPAQVIVVTAPPSVATPNLEITAQPETPVPTATLTPGPATPSPEPTMTPNPRYKILRVGAKGDDVRKLQQRLAELGYLQGNIDGTYGNQTKAAVIKFQRVNGLSPDGDAGPATLTHLYQDPNVLPNPETVTPTPIPTATPDANGIIPQPDDPRVLWLAREGAAVVADGESLHIITREGNNFSQRNPRVWQRGDDMIVSISDMALASEKWVLTAENANASQLSVSGYAAAATMTDLAAANRKDEDAYCELYTLAVNGVPVDLTAGDWMYLDGEWYATASLLRKALNADVIWDAEENTLMIRILPPELAGVTD